MSFRGKIGWLFITQSSCQLRDKISCEKQLRGEWVYFGLLLIHRVHYVREDMAPGAGS